jgi:hypothetical protein
MFSGFVQATAIDARDFWLFSLHSSKTIEKSERKCATNVA